MMKREVPAWGPVIVSGAAMLLVLVVGGCQDLQWPTQRHIDIRWDASERNSEEQFGAVHDSLGKIGDAVGADTSSGAQRSGAAFVQLAAAVEEIKASSANTWTSYETGGVGLLTLLGSWFGFGRIKKKEEETASQTERMIKNNVDPLMTWIRESGWLAALNMKPPENPATPPMPPATPEPA